MKGRKPRQDELDLWKNVADQVTPISNARQFNPVEYVSNKDIEVQRPQFVPDPSISIKSGRKPLKNDLRPTLESRLTDQPVSMDRKAFKQLQRGKLKPDARIDLHGMTLDRAHGALNRFVLGSHASGKRLLLVITGKGKHRDEAGPIPVRLGVLRHQVPEWLGLAPLSSLVLQVTQAHVSHGGSGAYYVYLRRSR